MANTQPMAESVFELVTSLVDASLLAPIKLGEETRFSMLETIREFGLEQLAINGETVSVGQNHAGWYLALAERAEPDLYGGRRQPLVLELLDREHDNVRVALAWLLSAGEGEAALRMATALLRFWHARGHLGEGRSWIDQGLAIADSAPAALRAKGLAGIAALAWPQDDREAALSALDRALALVAGTDEREVLALARLAQANMAFDLGDFDLAVKSAQDGKALYEGLGRRWDAAIVNMVPARVASVTGDLARAEALCHDSLAVFREIGDEFGVATAHMCLGWFKTAQGEPDACPGTPGARAGELPPLGRAAVRCGEPGKHGCRAPGHRVGRASGSGARRGPCAAHQDRRD